MYDPMDDDVRLNRDERKKEDERTALNQWLGQQVTSRRTELSMSVEQLAFKVGKSPTWVRQLEGPSSNPRYNDLQKVFLELRMTMFLSPWPE